MNPPLKFPKDPQAITPVAEPQPARSHRAAELTLVVFFLVVIVGVPVIQTGVELQRHDRVAALEIVQQKPTAANLRAYEHGLEQSSLVARCLRPCFQFVQFAWLRDGGEKALVGRGDWLFYKPGFDDLLAASSRSIVATNDAAGAIIAWRDALAGRGIQLLVVPVPNKETVYPDRLTRRVPTGSSVIAPATRDLLERLKSANVAWVDLFALFSQSRTNGQSKDALYLARDSHWSPAGVGLAAKAVAQALVEKGWIRHGQSEYRERPVQVERTGDVIQMLQSPSIERTTHAEIVFSSQVMREDGGQVYRDDAGSEVLVLGDSFLRIYEQDAPGSAGFIAQLARELKQPMASLVSDGGASTLVRQELHRRPALLKNKRVVVWEFVERDIRLGTEGWQAVPLP